MRRDVFQAIADPRRREIMALIARRPATLNSVAENFDISRPAISKHVKILVECGLVVVQQNGRERFCTANFGKLSEVSLWVSQYKQFWETKLDALEQFLDKDKKPKKRSIKNKPKK